jgi:hypothetical protein
MSVYPHRASLKNMPGYDALKLPPYLQQAKHTEVQTSFSLWRII